MGKSPSRAAEYDGIKGIRINLETSVGMTRFVADTTDYLNQLAARKLPAGLGTLIYRLFLKGAITKCSISYGTRVDFTIATHDEDGRMLLVGGRLERFQRAFAEITGQQIAATWETGGSQKRGQANSRGGGGFLLALARVVDAVADGLQLAAAIEILSGDD